MRNSPPRGCLSSATDHSGGAANHRGDSSFGVKGIRNPSRGGRLLKVSSFLSLMLQQTFFLKKNWPFITLKRQCFGNPPQTQNDLVLGGNPRNPT